MTNFKRFMVESAYFSKLIGKVKMKMQTTSRIVLIMLSMLFFGYVNANDTLVLASDSLLNEQLTRGVQSWKQGNALLAYQQLDSVNSQPVNASLAPVKVKSAVWTATYLQEQRKYKPAAAFLDSALAWSKLYNLSNEQRRVLDAYASWYTSTGNLKAALAVKEASWKLGDSLNSTTWQLKVDSLTANIETLQFELAGKDKAATEKEQVSTLDEDSKTFWILGIVIGILVLIIFLMNGNLQRLKNAPPPPLRRTPEPTLSKVVTLGNERKVTPVVPNEEKPVVEAKVVEAPKENYGLTARLSEVELVLIKADVLSIKGNGENKKVRAILDEYLSNMPSIIKQLDDAIADNKNDVILQSLGELKPYLDKFGMTSTSAWITEIDNEYPEAKMNKLLSKVFQVRNHCRRAADEAKALQEKMS
jgi:hypothetical protein